MSGNEQITQTSAFIENPDSPGANASSVLNEYLGRPDDAGQAKEDQAEKTTSDVDQQDAQKRRKGGWQRKIEKLSQEKRELAERLARYESTRTAQSSETEAPAERSNAGDDGKAVSAAAEPRPHEQEEKVFRSLQGHLHESISRESDAAQLVEAATNAVLPKPHLGAIAAALMDEENPEQVYLHLLRNPKIVQGFWDMDPDAVYRKMLRIAAAVGSSSATARPRSSAPAPIKPVNGSSVRPTLDPSKMTLGEYVKQRNAGTLR